MKNEYILEESKEVCQIFKAIYFSKGLLYSELLEITGKKKSTLSEQLKPLKESGLIDKTYIKEKKDYLFSVNMIKEFEFKQTPQGLKNLKKRFGKKYKETIKLITDQQNLNVRLMNKNLFISHNLKQYKYLQIPTAIPIKNKSDLKTLF